MRNRSILYSLAVLSVAIGLFSEAQAQIHISRQVIGTTVFSSTPMDGRSLNFTAHTGEVFNATVLGGLNATVGFQQPDDDVLTSILTVNGRTYEITAYPNPVMETLTLDFGTPITELAEVQLIDTYGRTILSRLLTNQPSRLSWPEVGQLPSGSYFLRARSRAGQVHSLGTIIVAAH